MLKTKKRINGILLFDKDVGQSSNRALQKIKRIFGAQKAGHTGTLDVLASGLLPICFGESTKVSQYLLGARKTYLSEFRFGLTTSSGDLEGEVLTRERVDSLSKEMISVALSKFLGPLEQVPPMYSALKQKGVPLYRLARQGISVERKPRKIEIFRFELKSVSGNSATFEIDCSKGTYVRVIGADLAQQLGTVGHLTELRRLGAGRFLVDQSICLEDLDKEKWKLLSIEEALEHLPSIKIESAEAKRLQQGQKIVLDDLHSYDLVKIINENCFIGVGKLTKGLLVPIRMMV